jgi:hypothetical protein
MTFIILTQVGIDFVRSQPNFVYRTLLLDIGSTILLITF